jgi:hypothetical protein
LLSRKKTLSLCSGRSYLATSLTANVKYDLMTPQESHEGRDAMCPHLSGIC